MSFFLIILEVFAALSFITYAGILESKYYQHIHVEGLTIARDYVTLLLVLICLLSGMENHLQPVPDLDFSTISKGLQWIFHLSLIGILSCSIAKFCKIRFKYARQYLLARASLYFSITFEVLALLIILAVLTGFPW
jgi:hypothetical protein